MFLGRSSTMAIVLLCGGLVWTVHGDDEPPGVSINDVFVIHTAPEPGGCSADQVTILSRWFDESYDLAQSAAETQSNWALTQVKKLASTFFGIQPSRAVPPTILSAQYNINEVFNFLNAVEPEPRNKPHLFCDSTYLQKKLANDPVQDKNGNLIPKSGQPGKYTRINESYKSQLTRSRKPFWIDSLKAYEFCTEAEGADFCSDPTNMGVTSDIFLEVGNPASLTQIVTICPQAFTNPEYKDQLIPGVLGGGIAGGDHMRDFQPKSLTLLHECFHVVHGANMLSGDHEIYRPEECAMFALQNPADRAQEGQGPLANPDSYVYFAMGMYYYDRYNIDLSTLTVQEPS